MHFRHTCLPPTHSLPSSPIPQVLRLECAAEFSEPVDLKAFPDYAEEVTQPMDLGTVKVGRGGVVGVMDEGGGGRWVE